MGYSVGMKVGRLTIVAEAPYGSNRRWQCLCACGTTTLVYQPNLRSGRVQSCGCLRAENAAKRRKDKVTQDGYVFVKAPDHPRSNPKTGRVREHILVMEQMLGRRLVMGEEVHHKNADRADNRPANLELWNRSQPAGARVTDQVAWAREILGKYDPHSLRL